MSAEKKTTAGTTRSRPTIFPTQTLLNEFGGSASLIAETPGTKELGSGCDQCGEPLFQTILEIDGERWCSRCAGAENTRRLRERKPPLVRSKNEGQTK